MQCAPGQVPGGPVAAGRLYRGKLERLQLMDLSDLVHGGICPGVVGNVYVYKDDNHLTRTYVESMIPMFEERLLAATGWS